MAKPEKSEVPACNRPKQCTNVDAASFKTGHEQCWLSILMQFSLNMVHNLFFSEAEDFLQCHWKQISQHSFVRDIR